MVHSMSGIVTGERASIANVGYKGEGENGKIFDYGSFGGSDVQ